MSVLSYDLWRFYINYVKETKAVKPDFRCVDRWCFCERDSILVGGANGILVGGADCVLVGGASVVLVGGSDM